MLEVDWVADVLRHLVVWMLSLLDAASALCASARIEMVNHTGYCSRLL